MVEPSSLWNWLVEHLELMGWLVGMISGMFAAGTIYGTLRYKIAEHDRRIVKLEDDGPRSDAVLKEILVRIGQHEEKLSSQRAAMEEIRVRLTECADKGDIGEVRLDVRELRRAFDLALAGKPKIMDP